MRRAAFALCLLLTVTPALAVQPDEVLSDPAMEARARTISQKLRCPVCQGENIDESNAPISRDLRLYVRERLVQGDTDAQVVQAVTDRFGEYVLFDPPTRGRTLILWLAGPIMALIGLLIAWNVIRRRDDTLATEALSAEEKARLDKLMRGD